MDASTPLMAGRNLPASNSTRGDVELGRGNSSQTDYRPNELNVIGEGIQGVNTNRYLTVLAAVVNIPQVLAGFFVLVFYWNDPTDCDSDLKFEWKCWSIIQLILIGTHLLARIALHRTSEAQLAVSHLVATTKNALEALGLIWFVTGNLWLFGRQDEGCAADTDSPIYQLCLALIIILYIQICLPCILAVLMVPVLCFCFPCVVRIFSFFHDPMAGKGASENTINSLPIIKYGDPSLVLPDSGVIAESACCICFNEYSVGNELRKLPCGHALHKTCLDPWLKISATCPICRMSINNADSSERDIENRDRAITVTFNNSEA